jgi:hypothetical protein
MEAICDNKNGELVIVDVAEARRKRLEREKQKKQDAEKALDGL